MEIVTRILEAYRGKLDQIVITDMAEGHHEEFTAEALLYKVGRLAHLIQTALPSAHSDDDEHIIGIYLHAGCAYVIALLAVLHAGAIFLPLDPQWAQGKLQSILQQAHVSLVLWADTAVLGSGPVPDRSCRALEIPHYVLRPSVDPIGDHIHGAPFRKALEHSRPCSSVAYIMLTSGSTGKPQAVRGTLQGILNRCEWLQRFGPLRPMDVVCFHTAPTFVDSVWQVLGPLLAGARMCALAPNLARNPVTLVQALEQQSVTFFVGVPSLLAAMMRHLQARRGSIGLPTLRVLISSGEPLTLCLLRQLDSVLPASAAILNLYGSTEVAGDCTWFDARRWLRGEASGAWYGMPGYLAELEPSAACSLSDRRADRRHSAIAGSGSASGGASSAAGSSSSSSSSRAATEQGIAQAPAGVPIDDMAVFIAVPLHCEGWDRAAGEEKITLSIGGLDILAPGELGEVCVAGVGVADGYHWAYEGAKKSFYTIPMLSLNKPFPLVMWGEQKMVSHQAADPEGHLRVFRTGDLGRLSCQGLQLAGRLDLQAKIGGVRFDLTEVEACLAGHPLVGAAAAKVWPTPIGGQLCAYVELTGTGAELQILPGLEAELQDRCRECLLPAAVPSRVTVFMQLPRSAAGKLQRGALPTPDQAVAAERGDRDNNRGSAFTDPCEGFGGTEGATMRAFQAALGLQGRSLEPGTNFWQAGGDSLAANLVSAWLGVDADLIQTYPTARTLAAAIRRGEVGPSGPSDSHTKLPGQPAHAKASPAVASSNTCKDGDVSADQPPSKRPRLLSVSQAATMQHGGNEPDQAMHAPEPSLGGWVLERSGQIRVCPPAVALAEPQAQQGPAGAAAQWEGCASLLQQQARSGRGEAQGGGGEAAGKQQLELHWRVKLRECVDAPPLVLIPPSPAPDEASEAHNSAAARWYAFGCSHGGDVVCIDGASGQPVWRTRLEDRASTGMALTGNLQHLAVGLAKGQLAFLCTRSGTVLGTRNGAGRTSPAADPWLGLIWTVSHERQLLACKAPGGDVIESLQLRAAATAPLVFDVSRMRVYAALLDGNLVACTVDIGAQGDRGSALVVSLSVAWTHGSGGPLFAPPAVLPATGDVVIADVQGNITCLSAAAGDVTWKFLVGAAVFSPPCMLGQVGAGIQVILGSQDGCLHGLDGRTGRLLWSQPATYGDSASTGAPVRMTVTAWSEFRSSAVPAGQLGVLSSKAVSCASNGVIAGLEAQVAGRGCVVLAACQLPSDVYSAPVAFGPVHPLWVQG